MTTTGSAARTIIMGLASLTIEDVVDLAEQHAMLELSAESAFQNKITKGARLVEQILAEDGQIYGVTTGFGDSCSVEIPSPLASELPIHLMRFHGCGMGSYFSTESGRAVLVVRLTSLCYGYSGVSLSLLEALATLFRKDIIPLIPEEGSVGASGDLTPMSYVAGVLAGERRVIVDGIERETSEVFKEQGIKPYSFKPKEALAVMNGTPVMTALACIAYCRAEYLAKLASRITALTVLALKGNPFHFSKRLFDAKPHVGQGKVAHWIRTDLKSEDQPRNPERLQDRYSIRCAPHVIGVLVDALPFFRVLIETELNSANDNPLVDPHHEQVLHGGHFYGGHIAFVMDSMKVAIANICDLLDRQLALLVDPKFNNGLPANLSGARGDRAMLNHGFKAIQIGASAWTAEALKLAIPASIFSRSTECHNQDKVSLGTIAARDCLRLLDLAEQTAAAMLLASVHALELRLRNGELDMSACTPEIIAMRESVSSQFEFLDEDRPLEKELRQFSENIRRRNWPLYDGSQYRNISRNVPSTVT